MQAAEILPSLLELSIAIAGFSGVVAALQGQSAWNGQAQVLLFALLGSTLITAAMAMLAMVLLASPVSEEIAWSATSLSHAALLALVGVVRTLQIRRGDTDFTTAVGVVGASFLVLIAVQLTNGLAFRESWVCLAALAFYGFYGFGYFALLLRELQGREGV